VRTPTWAEVEAFLRADGGWQLVRQGKHDLYEKILPGPRVLSTHVSHAKDKSMHPDTFATICRMQLEVTVAEFWETILSGKRVRTGAVDAAPAKQPTVAMIMELKRTLRLSDRELEGITFEVAKQRLDEFHSRPKDEP